MFEIIPARTEPKQTIYDWYKRKDKIDFNPLYQRVSGLWDTAGKQLFIDSLINEFDVPKFYVHRASELESRYQYAIIDGKQRLQSIFEFIDNKFSLARDFILYNDETIDLSNKTYDEIGEIYPKIIQKFDQYILDVVQIITDDEDLIRELFLRLNEGVKLNNSEKRLSQKSYLNEQIKDIVKSNNFFKLIQFKNRRYEHEELLTKILLLEYEGSFTTLSKNKLDEFIKNNCLSNEEINKTIDTVKVQLDLMALIFQGKEKLLSQKSIIPIYYLLVREKFEDDSEKIGLFLIEFETLRYKNRELNIDKSNPVLIEFDRLNQQGANSKGSLKKRFIIIESFYNAFLKDDFNLYVMSNLDDDILKG